MYHLTTSQTQPKCSVNIICCIPDKSSSHYETHLQKLYWASSLPVPYGKARRGWNIHSRKCTSRFIKYIIILCRM